MSLPQRIYSQVPEFVRSDHPAFLEFLKAYYTWLTTVYSPNKIEDIVDIDNTADQFLEYFKKELDINGVLQGVDNRTYLRHIKELYASKGSSDGIEFLFKIIYDEKSSVQLPWDYVFKPSNGEWFQDISILVTPTAGNINTLLGNNVIITDDDGVKYQTVVTNINTRRNGVVELFIGRFTHEAPLNSIQSLTGDVTATLLLSTVKGTVEKRGSGFRIGQVFNVNSYGGSGSLVKVKAIDSNGGITAIEIIGFGSGYVTNFNILISPTGFIDPSSLGARITVGGLTYKTNDNANVQNEGGSIVRHNYTDLTIPYVTDPSYVGDTLGTIQSQPNTQYDAGDYASIKFIVGHVCIYPGYYKSSNNIIGDLVYIEDSYYYQAFSYVTVLEKRLEDYRDLLKRTLHPAGTKHFATYQLIDNFQITPVLDPSLNLISKADAIRDAVSIIEQLIFSLQVVYADTATASDVFNRTFNASRSFSDTATVTESKNFDIYPVYSDNAVVTESFDRIFNAVRSFNDTSTATESFDRIFNAVRSFNDTSTLLDTFNRVVSSTRLFNDTSTLSDTFNRTWSANALLADPITMADTFSAENTAIRNFSETLNSSDAFARAWTANKTLTDTSTLSDVFTRTWNANKTLTDTSTLSDVFGRTWNANKSLTDTASISENITLAPGIAFAHSITATETIPVFHIDKYSTETVITTNSGGLAMTPYYVGDGLTTYWAYGYLENEREFTN